MLNKNRAVDEGLIKAIAALLKPEEGFCFKLKESLSYYEIKDLFLFLKMLGGKNIEGLEVDGYSNRIYNGQDNWSYIGIDSEGDIDLYTKDRKVEYNFLYDCCGEKLKVLDDNIREEILYLKELYTKPRCSPSSASLIKK